LAKTAGIFLPTLDGLSAIWSTSQTITAVFNPISSSMDAALSALKNEAASLDKIPFIYKCNSPNASALRRYHWSIMYMSDGAMIVRRILRSTHQSCANYGLPRTKYLNPYR
jgi:hypothetical protein